jgi:hypothetical protein
VVETDELAPLPHQDCLCVVLLHVQDGRHAYMLFNYTTYFYMKSHTRWTFF